VQDELLGTKVHIGSEKSLLWFVRDGILREATRDESPPSSGQAE